MSVVSLKHDGTMVLFAFACWAYGPVSFAMPSKSSPRPAVARIIVPEEGATSYGSGTLIDVRDQYGLVVTNWHVVRDAQGLVEVVFPNGFRSHARPVKLDADWDLAALVIWRPPIRPVSIADRGPQLGDTLTICGYGQGVYREATGRCTQYLAPGIEFPREMVELDVEARLGDSGGPIFNDRGGLAGVLFGASRGTTLGSFGGRVENFLASLAPDIGRPVTVVAAAVAPPVQQPAKQTGSIADTDRVAGAERRATPDSADQERRLAALSHLPLETETSSNTLELMTDLTSETRLTGNERSRLETSVAVEAAWPSSSISFPDDAIAFSQPAAPEPPVVALAAESTSIQAVTWREVAGETWSQQAKTLLAFVGLIVIVLWILRLAL